MDGISCRAIRHVPIRSLSRTWQEKPQGTTVNPFRRLRPNPKRSELRRVRDREKLYGQAKIELRRQAFERSGGRCEETPIAAHCSLCHETFPNAEVVIRSNGADVCPRCKAENFTCVLDGHYECVCGENRIDALRCERSITWESMHLSHDRHGPRKSDTLSTVKATCEECHRLKHNGGKPVPRRLGRVMRWNEAIPYLKSQTCVCGKPKKQDKAFCEGCNGVISPQSRLNLETLTGREWLKAMADAEGELLAELAKGTNEAV